MASSARPSQNVATRPIHQQAVQHRLHRRQFAGHTLSELGRVTQRLRLDAAQNALGLFDQLVKLLAGMDVEFSKPLEKLADVFDGSVAENSRLDIFELSPV